jgi:hypothetical protein
MLQIIKPNSKIQDAKNYPTIFLAGSIEMGNAEDWQVRIQNELADYDVTIFNPRRDDWDSSWKQEASNPEFSYQVNWELDSLDYSNIIFLYFSPDTKSPISLLELGLHADTGNIIVCCPEGFWRRGNVEIVCQRKGLPLFDNLEDALIALKKKIELKIN